jgi:hypothetical protein
VGGGVAEGEELGVGRRVADQFPLVVAAGEDGAVRTDHDRPDGDVPMGEGRSGLLQCQCHRDPVKLGLSFHRNT